MRYIVITPARDEERLLPGLLDSMLQQTCLPSRWIIVNDGSSDSTAEIIDRAANQYSWIEPRHLPTNGNRVAGGESAVERLLKPALADNYDFILRLDADLTFGPQMVELLLREFALDPALGIAGATLYEPGNSGWHEIPMPRFHTRGAVKLYSAACFRAIGGIDSGQGWDTIDEASAMMLGFKTRSFRHIHARHHRPQGAAGGLRRGRVAAGRAAYRAGYSSLFMCVRAAARIGERPYLVGSIFMLAGYFEGYLRGLPRGASRDLVKFVKRQQLRRLLFMDTVWR